MKIPGNNNLDWKKYEEITKYIYETLGKESGVKIKGYGNNCKVNGKSGISHQIDVLTTHSDGIHTYKTAIECKYWKEKINKDIVMKVSSIIEDADISKGVIVTKSGFTKDGLEYAKFKNIGLVELRESTDKDHESAPKEIEIATLPINLNITATRPKLLQINLGNNRYLDVQDEFDLFNYFILLKDGKRVPFYDYVTDFRLNIADQKEMNIEITKSYKLPKSHLFRRGISESIPFEEVTITGKLTQNDYHKNLEFTLVDKVWLLMKSIFDERTFSFSENGLIIEHKKI
ncbi:restriction endonuclease [Flavobacterium sp. HJJ]|uniref:restriction endonuclease n=1 Tax=Flavobacterium sp. HJJ TaxID=2783792 RepID=UPI00188A9381|nr:restriction endonuclease [Flavobacterium sp. HJJ]MBF4473049.1 restriction endonuclease [Flavobacterium sp. HJJ]